MRWAEAVLFLTPFLLYAVWRVAAVRASPALVWSAVAAVAVLATVTIALGLTRRLDPGETYVPAHIEHGVIVPGHGVRGG